jgi:beta-glucosidase/6-phospho-beta-glucosidase/beta-galactosidase
MTNVTPYGEALPFPPGFTWGAATAAYQIEGATDADGRGPSVWDTFSRTPGKVRGGDTGDVACDSYHRYPEDADLLRSLGLSAYRFSVSWPRVFPTGGGQLNQAGLDYYKRLLDTLGEREITAAATLFHWDLPQALQDRGGWADRDTAYRFADYAGVVAEALGDRVKRWITLNEPLVVAHNGHRIGVHAPGLTDDAVAAAVTHHLLLGHGLGTAALRAVTPDAEVGITLNLTPVRVAASANGSAEALERARLVADAVLNGTFLDPVLFGRYPAHAPAELLPPAELIKDGDMETIAAPIDFLGVNYYQPEHLRAGDPDNLRRDEDRPLPGIEGGVVAHRPGRPVRAAAAAVQGRPWPPAVHHGERLRRRGLRQPGRRGQRPGADQVPAPAPGGRGPGGPGRGEPGGLLRVVPARQLRVGLRVPEAVRDRVRRLRHPAPDPEGELRLLRAGGQRERGSRAARRLAGVTRRG